MKHKQKIKSKEEVRIVFYVHCPICKKEIKGTKASQVDYNLSRHIAKHEKEKRK